jgi:FkbM family methyltransferase
MASPLPPISYEEINLDYIRHLIGANAKVIVEVGAHHGWHTQAFLKTFSKARIYAFEPDPRAIEIFSASISSPYVHLFKMAVGAIDGKAKFHVSSGLPPGIDPIGAAAVYPRGWDQSGSLRAPKAHKERWPWCKFESVIDVAVCRLDTWARKNRIGTIDFIWADTQGAEGDLISGGQATLARTRYLYLEYSNDEVYEGEPTLQMLLDMLPNYSVIKRFPGDVLLKNLHVSN